MSKVKTPNSKLERYKILWEISEASPIIRRYFAMNFFDGVLTALGIVLAGFAFYLTGSAQQTKGFLFFSGLTTAIAIGISGLTGSHLAESAERSLNVIQMKQVLGLMETKVGTSPSEDQEKPKYSEKDILLALGKFEENSKFPPSKKTPRKPRLDAGIISALKSEKGSDEPQSSQETIPPASNKKPKKPRKVKIEKTMFEEAQDFAGKIAAFVDGFSPFAGVMIVVLPFVFGDSTNPAGIWSYIISFSLSVIVLFLLGTYLAKLSRESILKFGLQMVAAAVFTGVLTVFFNWVLNSSY